MKSPAFQFYPAEFLADENVVMMSNQELGCYIKLMCYCWREGSIPADNLKISRLCGENHEVMAKLWIAIGSCFKELENDHLRLVHPRLEKERLKQLEHKKERSESGKKGAESRWNKELQNNGSAIKEPLAIDGSSSSSSTSSSTVDIKESKKKTKTSFPKEFTPTAEHLEFASLNSLNVRDEFVGFKLHHEAKLTTSGNWNSSFSTWLRNAVKFKRPEKKGVQDARLEVARQIMGDRNGNDRQIVDIASTGAIEGYGARIPEIASGLWQPDDEQMAGD